MTYPTSKRRPRSGAKNRIRIQGHLVGIWFTLLCATFPQEIKTIKMLGNFPLRIADIVYIFILLVAIQESKTLLRISNFPITFFLIASTFAAAYQGVDIFMIHQDLYGFLCFGIAFVASQQLKRLDQLDIFLKYVLFTLWFSLLVLVLRMTGFLQLAAPLRLAFDYVPTSIFGRFVTSTLVLAWVTTSITLYMYYKMQIKLRHFIGFFIPAFLIVVISGSRLSILFLLLPSFFVLFSSDSNKGKQILKLLSVLLPTAILISLILLSTSTTLLSTYLQNYFKRVFTLFDSDYLVGDSSTGYRLLEIQMARDAIGEKPFLGYGFGVPYTDAFFYGSASDWLTLHGTQYVHSTPLWILAKMGILGFVVCAAFFTYPYKKSSYRFSIQKVHFGRVHLGCYLLVFLGTRLRTLVQRPLVELYLDCLSSPDRFSNAHLQEHKARPKADCSMNNQPLTSKI